MTATFLLLGAVLIVMTLAEHPVRELPLSAALIYLVIGWAAGTLAPASAAIDLERNSGLLLVASEWAVLISLFALGLRLRLPKQLSGWRVALLLASSVMVLTIVLTAAAATALLGLSWPAAILLAAILAPTDPVLASEVRIHSTEDRDAVRWSLTAEGGLNDGTALPGVMLGLGALNVHELGAYGREWLIHDLLWPIGGGLVLGWYVGRIIGWTVRHHLRRGHALAWDELLYIGTIALTYGIAVSLEASSFLVVFAAGMGLFYESPAEKAAMTAACADCTNLQERMMAFGERCERLVEVLMVLFIGAALALIEWHWQHLLFALVLVFIVRPMAVIALIRRKALPGTQRRLVAWFGIRGVGALFYLVFALEHGTPDTLAHELTAACLVCIAVSIFVHGVSATPLMTWYQRRRSRRI